MKSAEFDSARFESLMDQAVVRHNIGQYQEALDLSYEAFCITPADSSEEGRAARDISARFDRLYYPDCAYVWAKEAFRIHDGIVSEELGNERQPSREAWRESSVSAMYVGVNGLRRIIRARKQYLPSEKYQKESDKMMVTAWFDIKRAKRQAPRWIDRQVDQYEINAARRVSIEQSLIGKRSRGLKIGAKAVALAFMSESPLLDTTNHKLSFKDRMKAKGKALLGGLGAVGVGLLSLSRDAERPIIAYEVADRVL